MGSFPVSFLLLQWLWRWSETARGTRRDKQDKQDKGTTTINVTPGSARPNIFPNLGVANADIGGTTAWSLASVKT